MVDWTVTKKANQKIEFTVGESTFTMLFHG